MIGLECALGTRDREGKSAWTHAFERGKTDLVSLLEKAGAARDYLGMEWKGHVSRQKEAFIKIVETKEEWNDVWRRALEKPAPDVDFENYVVASVFLGHSAPWLYSIGFAGPRQRGERWVISYALHDVMLRLAGPFQAGGQYAMKVFEKKKGRRNDSGRSRLHIRKPPQKVRPCAKLPKRLLKKHAGGGAGLSCRGPCGGPAVRLRRRRLFSDRLSRLLGTFDRRLLCATAPPRHPSLRRLAFLPARGGGGVPRFGTAHRAGPALQRAGGRFDNGRSDRLAGRPFAASGQHPASFCFAPGSFSALCRFVPERRSVFSTAKCRGCCVTRRRQMQNKPAAAGGGRPVARRRKKV